jgi:hypothetical protein
MTCQAKGDIVCWNTCCIEEARLYNPDNLFERGRSAQSSFDTIFNGLLFHCSRNDPQRLRSLSSKVKEELLGKRMRMICTSFTGDGTTNACPGLELPPPGAEGNAYSED